MYRLRSKNTLFYFSNNFVTTAKFQGCFGCNTVEKNCKKANAYHISHYTPGVCNTVYLVMQTKTEQSSQ